MATYYDDAFGVVLERTGDIGNNIGYAGYQYDEETGLYYLNARMYSPNLGRFLQEDTYLGSKDDPLSLNLYAYCHNEPIMYYDPTGHWAVGDEKLSAKAQAQIGRWTNEYYAAEARGDTAGMSYANKKAEAIRTNAATTANTKNVTPSGAAKTAAISNSTKSDSSGNYITADTWVSVGGSTTTRTTTSPSTDNSSNTKSSSLSSSSNAVKPTTPSYDSVYTGTPSTKGVGIGSQTPMTLGLHGKPTVTTMPYNSRTNPIQFEKLYGSAVEEGIELVDVLLKLLGASLTWIAANEVNDAMNERNNARNTARQIDESIVLDPDYDVTREDILGAYAPQTGSLPKVFADAFAGVDDQDKPKYFAAYIDTRYDAVMPIAPLSKEGAMTYVPTIWPHEDKHGVFAINDKAAKELVDSLGGVYDHHRGKKVEGYYPHYHPMVRKNAHVWYPGK